MHRHYSTPVIPFIVNLEGEAKSGVFFFGGGDPKKRFEQTLFLASPLNGKCYKKDNSSQTPHKQLCVCVWGGGQNLVDKEQLHYGHVLIFFKTKCTLRNIRILD